MKSHYPRIIALTERMVDPLLEEQVLDPGSRDYGGQVTLDRGFSEPGASAAAVAVLTSLVCCPESRYHGSAELSSRALLYAEHLLKAQHADGTLDLRDTNFHDATMVGFSVQKLGYTFRLLRSRTERSAALDQIMSAVRRFLERGAEGMLAGGFHTPNHRWVMASGLSLLSAVLGDERLKAEAGLYLAEGIDCTEEGEYTERSAGIYNVVNNRSLIIVAEELDRPELLAHVRRNLDMVHHYFEPDGSVFTLNSRRQDAGRVTYPVNYYENYLLMAHRDRNPLYAGIAGSLLDLASEGRGSYDGIGPVLTHFLLARELTDADLPSEAPPAAFRFQSRGSGVVRLREGAVSLSLLTGHTAFMRFQTGELSLIAKIAGTFYGPRGRFIPSSVEGSGDSYVLKSHNRWGYVRPLADPPASPDWDAMPHAERGHVMMSDFDIEVRADFGGGGVELRIRITGTDGVPVKVELLLSPDGWLEADSLRLPGRAGEWCVLKGGTASYTLGHDRLTISEGFAEHNSTVNMRGSEPQDTGAYTVYCTGYTPMERSIAIRSGR